MPSPRSAPPPLSRWGETWRLAVAVLLGLVLWLLQFTEDLAPDSLIPLLDLIVGIGALVAMHWRRRWPAAIAVGTALATAVSALAVVASLIAFVSLVTTRRWKPTAITVAVGCGASVSYDVVTGGTSDDFAWWVVLLGSMAVYGAAVLTGLYLGARRELVVSQRLRAETAEREQAARVDQARLSERARIAREMHDVLAHRISLLALHAGAMTFRTDLSVAELRASARVVQDNAQQAMLDLRDVLGVLRDPAATDPEAPLAAPDRPQPTLADLPGLVQEATEAGADVHLTGLPEGTTPPDTTGRTAYRIIQEALTNARKHAPGAPVTLRLSGRPGDRLTIEVSNPARVASGPAAAAGTAAVPGSGLGLVGLVERAEQAGGDVEHGWTADREYRIRAWLPWPA